MSYEKAFGIDLGTTYSCAAVAKGNEIITCESDVGTRTIPSYVCISENDILVGQVAIDETYLYLNSVIYDVKRLMGQTYKDYNKFKDQNWPFKVVVETERLKIEIDVIDKIVDEKKRIIEYKKKRFYPEEISKLVLLKMKEFAESCLSDNVNKVVITVPAYFNNAQRQATINAAKLANLEVLRLINEPTAAAITYKYNNKIKNESNFLVFDFGGGTLDVSIIKILKNNVKVLFTDGDTFLGGRDFDNNLLNYCLEVMKEEYGIDINKIPQESSKKIRARLKDKCEKAKITLSTAITTKIVLDTLYDGKDVDIKITRLNFEDINEELFTRCMNIVDRCLKNASNQNIDIKKIKVILVGGSTRIPKIKELLEDKFQNNININKSLNPDEAVAHGAAIIADALMRTKHKDNDPKRINLQEVTPLSLGVESRERMSVILPKYTEIPMKITKEYSTVCDDQKMIEMKIYEGEEYMAEENTLLHKLEITDIPSGQKGSIKFDVTFDISIDSLLTVSVVEKSTNELKAKIEISRDKTTIPAEEFNRIKREDLFFQENKIELSNAKHDLLRYVKDKSETLSRSSFSKKQKKILKLKYKDTTAWVRGDSSNNKDEIVSKKDELESLFMNMIDSNNDSTAVDSCVDIVL